MSDVRTRADRITEETAQRRRRSDTTIDGGQRLKLAVPPEVAARLKSDGRSPRWVNDEGNRIHNLTKLDDYDRVDGVDPVVVGTTKDGHPIKSYLHSKPEAFIREDRQKLDDTRRETEVALMRGKNPTDPIAHDDSFYAVEGNRIRRGSSG